MVFLFRILLEKSITRNDVNRSHWPFHEKIFILLFAFLYHIDGFIFILIFFMSQAFYSSRLALAATMRHNYLHVIYR